MSITITREERDALYGRIVMHLNGIDGVYRAVEEENWEGAQKLGLEFSDLLRFVCDDLGWGGSAEGTFDLGVPVDVLARAAESIRDLAEADVAYFEGERRDLEERENAARYLRQTCERLLGELRSGGPVDS